ncbi:hypothetical protein KIL84_016778, partial [Mauremys mutica]
PYISFSPVFFCFLVETFLAQQWCQDITDMKILLLPVATSFAKTLKKSDKTPVVQ